jgi:hypothetical protein
MCVNSIKRRAHSIHLSMLVTDERERKENEIKGGKIAQ